MKEGSSLKICDYQPLNLYGNYLVSAQKFPYTLILFDEVLRAFPELETATTYMESLAIIQKRAYQLAQLGIGRGDKVLLYKSPKFDTYLLAVAVSYLGAVPAMISYHLPAETIEVFIDRLEQPFLIYDEVTEGRVKAVRRDTTNLALSVEIILETEAPEVPQAELALDEISYMTHTSGTTGIPKLICHSANSMGWRTAWQKSVIHEMGEPGLVAFHISPVHSRFNIGVSSLMALGFPMMPLANAQFESVSKMLTAHPPLALETHPNHFVQWTQLAKKQPELFAQTKYYHSTFDAINNGTMRAFLTASQATDPLFLQVYGQSECGPMIIKAHTLASLEHSNARDMGVGLADLTKARICDEEGQVLPPNTDGNIHFLSKGRALTYYKEDARFQKTVFGKWWDSGDYGSMDEQGHLYLKDRQVDLIDSVNSTLTIEDYLLDQLDFLEEVVLIRGIDDKAQPVLAVVPDQEMDWDAWWEKVSDLPHMHYPIVRAFDEIPHTATMKVQRLQLEKELKEQTN